MKLFQTHALPAPAVAFGVLAEHIKSRQRPRYRRMQALRELEVLRAPFPWYFRYQTHVTCAMRAVLIDWMMEVADEFLWTRETLYLAVSYVDRFLSSSPPNETSNPTTDGTPMDVHALAHTTITKKNLQLLGVTALFVAAKYEEVISSDLLRDICETTDKAFQVTDMVEMERILLHVLGWKVDGSTPFAWVRMIQTAASQLLTDPVSRSLVLADTSFYRAMHAVDRVTLHSCSLLFYPSQLAAAALTSVLPAGSPAYLAVSHVACHDAEAVAAASKVLICAAGPDRFSAWNGRTTAHHNQLQAGVDVRYKYHVHDKDAASWVVNHSGELDSVASIPDRITPLSNQPTDECLRDSRCYVHLERCTPAFLRAIRSVQHLHCNEAPVQSMLGSATAVSMPLAHASDASSHVKSEHTSQSSLALTNKA
jgi:hypothetical protein